MSSRLHRSATKPIRVGLSWDDRWMAPDRGLIACWERGREMRAANERYPAEIVEKKGRREERKEGPIVAEAAARGELPILPWRGGVEQKLKAETKLGSLQYLAMWQGLRGEDLDIDVERETEICCTWTRQRVVFSRAVPPEPEDDPTPTA